MSHIAYNHRVPLVHQRMNRIDENLELCKALGAKRYVILLEFLIESIILCLIGGAVGLLLVSAIIKALSNAIDFDMYLSFGNMVLGVVVSVLVGIVSGAIPAIQAARMDPVDAMRHG